MSAENNKLIAEFMGCKEQTDPTERWFGQFFNKHGERIGGSNKEPLLYHTSWDELMTVVDKIESLGYSYDRINADVFINTQEGKNIIPNPMDCNTMTMIQKTYFIVVEFIKLYNENEKS